MGNNNVAFVETPDYAIIMVRHRTMIGDIDMLYCINDHKQINKIETIDRVNKKVKISSGPPLLPNTAGLLKNTRGILSDSVSLCFKDKEPSMQTLFNATDVLNQCIDKKDSEMWVYPTIDSICKDKPVRYLIIAGTLTEKN